MPGQCADGSVLRGGALLIGIDGGVPLATGWRSLVRRLGISDRVIASRSETAELSDSRNSNPPEAQECVRGNSGR